MLSRAGSRRAGAQYLWGSLDELFVNLTSPLRIQAFIGSLLPDPRLTQRAKREQRAGSRKTGTRHGIVKLTKTWLTDPQDDGLESCREPGMLGVNRSDSA